jgi:hypothetical protein
MTVCKNKYAKSGDFCIGMCYLWAIAITQNIGATDMTEKMTLKWYIQRKVNGPHQSEFLTRERTWSHMLNHAERFATEVDAQKVANSFPGSTVLSILE